MPASLRRLSAAEKHPTGARSHLLTIGLIVSICAIHSTLPLSLAAIAPTIDQFGDVSDVGWCRNARNIQVDAAFWSGEAEG